MFIRKVYSVISGKLQGLNHSASKCTVNLCAALLICMIPSLQDATAATIPGGLLLLGGVGADSGGIGSSLCVIVSWFSQGSVGAAIASLAVIFLGIGAFFGKVTWGMAIMFATGIFAIFGAQEIVGAIIPFSGPFVGCSASGP